MTNERTEAVLKAKGIVPTAMRILVLEYLQKGAAAVSLVDLERNFPYSDRTTLYRTLKTFEEKGLVHDVQDGTEVTRYALCADACKDGVHYDLHLHFYCYTCKQTFCLPKHTIPAVRVPEKYQLLALNLSAKGICEACCS